LPTFRDNLSVEVKNRILRPVQALSEGIKVTRNVFVCLCVWVCVCVFVCGCGCLWVCGCGCVGVCVGVCEIGSESVRDIV
jgi:hypothetical protein